MSFSDSVIVHDPPLERIHPTHLRVLLLLGILFGVIYIAYCFMEKAQCPVCETSAKLMEPPHHDKMQ